MKSFILTFVILILTSCSFDNKTGIWKDASNIIVENNQAQSLEDSNEKLYEDLFTEKKIFNERLKKIDWNIYYKSWPFNESALTLYEWAPIAEELKSLDRKIVLNSMILKWDNIKNEFAKLIKV